MSREPQHSFEAQHASGAQCAVVCVATLCCVFACRACVRMIGQPPGKGITCVPLLKSKAPSWASGWDGGLPCGHAQSNLVKPTDLKGSLGQAWWDIHIEQKLIYVDVVQSCC